MAVSITPTATRSTFRRRAARARRLSALGSLSGHALLLALLISGAATLAGLSRLGSVDARPGNEDRSVSEVPPPFMTVVDPPQHGSGVSDPDPALYRKLLRLGVKDLEGLSPAEARQRLAELTGQVDHLADEALADIGRFLGTDPNRYNVRTYYKDELNPNINFLRARVVRAFRFAPPEGEAGYTITLQDKEMDAFTFTLTGAPARELGRQGLRFGARQLQPGRAASLELKGARIRDIRPWRSQADGRRRRGVIVVIADAEGRARELHIPGGRHTPLVRAETAYARTPGGAFLHDPEDETTVFTSEIDMQTATLWKVTEAESRTPGVTRARVVMLDAKGNRFIFFCEGQQAKEMLARARVLNENPTLQRIYEKTGAAGFLLQLLQQNPREQAPQGRSSGGSAERPARPSKEN